MLPELWWKSQAGTHGEAGDIHWSLQVVAVPGVSVGGQVRRGELFMQLWVEGAAWQGEGMGEPGVCPVVQAGLPYGRD